jgi:acyl dehydratase
MRYFEDFQPGDVIPLGSCIVRREEIIAFARKFDPQPFHMDDEAAGNSIFGGIIASGWHTAAMCHRLLVEGLLKDTSSLGSPGLDELRWLRPVRPGDELSVRIEVLSLTPSRSKPDRGSIKTRLEALNQEGEVVMTEVATVLFSRRASESAESVETHFAREGLPAATIRGP